VNNVSTPGSFENEWIKFNYPASWQVADGSDSKTMLVQVYQGNFSSDTNLRLSMNFAQTNRQNLIERFPDAKNITIAGTDGIMAQDEFGIYGYAFLKDGNVENTTLVLYCALGQEEAFNQVKDTMVVKKLPSAL
jgi:hypothetical protein